MFVKYIGVSRVSLTNGKIYEVLSVEKEWYRLEDDFGEDYLFPPNLFEIISNADEKLLMI